MMSHMPNHMTPIPRRAGIAACLRILVVAAMMMCGLVGEKFDGYAAVRGSATPAVRKLVANVNSQRRKIYAKRAREQKISSALVGKTYAGKIVAKAPKGTWILLQSGAWKRK